MDPLQKKKLNGLLLGSSCLVASAFIGALPALANPTGPHVVSGHDKVSTSGNTTTVDQTSQKGFIDWNSFSIGSGETVKFVQPGKGSVTVNRVTGGDPSKILGELLANGGVWIINGNGILFGKGSIVNVGSLIATTSDLGDDDFKKGKYRFKKGSNPDASVINQGTITATNGGSVVLSAAHVANEGVIQANLGKVVLGGAAAFTVDLNGDNLIRYQITKPVSKTPTNSNGDASSALVSNSGTIEANGGSVLMTSRAASNVQDNVVNNSGIIEATSVRAHDGEVDLDAEGGTVKDSGTVDVSGTQAGQTGGDVTITGRKIVVADGAHIDAQGADGGGTVLIGGGMHGEGKLEQARKVVIGKAVIDVDATSKGNGGKVGVWSKGKTTVNAVIDAEGGRISGNGGYVETSGHELGMDASALVDTSAAKGIGGTWLLDPTDIIIDNCGGNCSVGQVDATVIGNSLSAGTNVTIEAIGTGAGSGNITVESNVIADGAGTLNLLATFDIDVEASIQNAGSGSINLVAGWDGVTGVPTNTTATGKSSTSVNITAITSTPGAYGKNGGSVTIGYADSGTAISVGSAGGTTTVAAQNLYVGVSGCVTANAQLGYMGSGGGDIDIDLTGDLTVQSDQGGVSRIGNGGSSFANGTGNITINAGSLSLDAYSARNGSAIIGNAGTGTVSGNIAITTTGDVSMDAGSDFAKYNTVSIGNETSNTAGASGNIKLAVGGGLSMYANYGGTARIGSYSATSNIKVTAAGNVTMQAGGNAGCEYCIVHPDEGANGSEESSYSTVQIGNHGGATSSVGGNVSVTSTGGNITLTAYSAGSVEIGNSGGLHVSGDVSVVAANGSITMNAYYAGSYAQIGNAGGGGGGTVAGNITVFAETGLSLNTKNSGGYSQIGNYSYAGSGATVSGDIFISAFGGTTINGGGGTSVWIGNRGDTEVGNVTLVTGSLDVSLDGDADSATFGNMVASDLTGSVTTATAATGGSGGGNVTIAIEGNGTTNWGTLFGSGLDFANGNTLSLITEGAMVVSTSITAAENGNINLVAGWDGTTGYGPRSIIIGDILSTPSAFGSTGGDITIGGANAPGDVTVGSFSGNTTVAAANVTLDAADGFAQIGFNGGGGSGNIDVLATGAVDLDGTNGFAQIGNGGENANGDNSGNITVSAGGAVDLQADGGYVQIGNGGANSNSGSDVGSNSGNITVVGASVTLQGGVGSDNYAQIGHGGVGSDEAEGSSNTGNISVTATTGNITLTAGSSDSDFDDSSYAQIGMGGPFSGTDTSNLDTGNITVKAIRGSIVLTASTDPDLENGFALIGDSGTAEKSGNITVTAGGNISLSGGAATDDAENSFAMIGDDNQGDVTANVSVKAGGNLTLTGGAGNGDMAQIGSNGDSGNVTGNVTVTVGKTTTLVSTTSGADAWIGDGYQEGGTFTGSTTFITKDLITSADALGDFDLAVANDLIGGNVTLEFTDKTGTVTFGGVGDYDSTNTLKLLSEGNVDITGDIQNAGSGAIYVIGGWDGTTLSSSDLTNTGVYGNNHGSVTIGGGADAASVGSEGGNTTVAGYNVTVDGQNNLAQIGWDGASGGNVSVVAAGNVTVEAGSDITAMIGNGGAGVTGAVTGNITITTAGGALNLRAPGDGAIAEVGDLTDGASSEDSNITIDTNGGAISLASGGSSSFAQIGNWEDASNDGNLTGNITINAGAITINANGTDSSSQIGNGNYLAFANNGTVGGVIDIHATTLTVEEAAPEGGFDEARIGNLGDGVVTGDVDVTTTGSILISADGGGAASIGDYSNPHDSNFHEIQGEGSGTIDVVSGGNITLSSNGAGAFTSIEFGGASSGAVDVTAQDDITEDAIDGGTSLIGAGLFFNGGVNIDVTSNSGDVVVQTTGAGSIAQIGNVEYNASGAVAGNITVQATDGDIEFLADGNQTNAIQIGNQGGSGGTASGNLILAAGNELDIENGADVLIGNTGVSETGNVTITAVSLVGDISPSIGNDLDGGNFTVTLSGNQTLTLATDIDVDSAHALSLSNGGDIVFTGSIQNSGSGNITVDSQRNILIGGANATGNVAVGSGGTTFFSADNITLDAVNGYAQIGYHGNGGGNITLDASDAVTLTGGASNVAQIGDGATFNTSGAGGNVSIVAASLGASGKSDIAGQTADIALSGHGNVGSANHPLEFAVNDLAIQTNGGNVFSTSGQSVSLGVGSDGIDLDGGGFSLAANGSVTQTQAILAGTIDISGSSITLRNAGNAFGAVTLDATSNASIFDTRNLVIANADVGGMLSLSSGGNISQTGAIIAVALNATASHGAITLTNTANSFGDATLKASGNASLFDASDLTITNADIGGALSLSGGGNIGQSGAIDAASLNVTASNGAITLTNTGNDFASASLNSSGNATLYDASDLVLTGADVGETLSLTSVGNITQTGAITANALDVVADAITLTNAGNSFGSAMLDASGNASLFDASDLTITSAEIGGTFTLSGGGNIDQTGAITADALDVTASNGSIALTNAGNTIGSAALTSSGNASLSDASSLTITGANVGGTLTLVDTGSIGQTGAIAANTLDVTAGTITLTDSANAISKADLNALGNAALSDSVNLKITGADVGGTLTLKDAHSITQSGAIHAKTLHATARQITLANSANEISNADLSAKNDAALSDASNLTITGADVGGTLTLTDTGAIGQSGAIVAGTLDVTAGSISLTNAANAISTASLTSSGDASLVDADGLTIAGANVGGTLSITDAGNIGQSGAITAAALDVTADAIKLTNTGNSFARATIDASGNASLFDASDLTVVGATVGGTLTLTDAGSISQSGAISADALNATAENGTIALTNAGNTIADASLTSSGNAALTDASNLTITGADVGGTFTLVDGGSVGQTGAITAKTLDATAASMALTDSANAIGKADLSASGNAELSDSTNLKITGADIGGTLTLTDEGIISQSGAITANALDATAKNIVLTGSGNKIASADLSAKKDASLSDASNLTITGANVGGTLTLTDTGSIGQSGAIMAKSLDVTAGTVVLTNSGNSFGDATIDASGNASLFDAADLSVDGADVGGTLTLTDAGSIGQSGAITADALNATAGAITLTNSGNAIDSASLTATGDAALSDASNLTITGADVGGTLTLTDGGSVGQTGAIVAGTLDVTAGSISLTNAANAISTASLTSSGGASLVDADSLTIANANVGGNLSLSSAGDIGQSGAITAAALNVTADAIKLTNTGNSFARATIDASGNASLFDASDLTVVGATVGGTMTLTDAGSIRQSGAISAGTLNATAENGTIALTNAGNTIADASLTSSGNAALTDASNLTITGADVGGTFTLVDGGSVGQTGAITAKTLDVTADAITLTDSANAIDKANLSASGNAALSDSSNLKITGADVGGTLTLKDAGSVTQTGAISADALDVTAKHITLTNTANSFGSASVDATDDASLFDASSVVISGADVGGTFTLASGGDISQSGVLAAGTLDATAAHGSIALTNAGNAIGDVSLTSSGDATVYDSISMALQNASVGGNLTLLAEGSLTFDSSVQLSNGNILAVAGWDGTTTSASGLTGAGAYGNHGGSIIVGGTRASGDVAIGSQTGSTTLAGANVSLEADNGYAQVGYHGSASGALEVLATQAVALSGGTGSGDYAQIGNGGMDTSGNESGNITVKAGGAVTLDGGTGADAYAQIGHGGADADKNSDGYTNTGTITVQGQSVALVAGSGNQSYTQIGQGGFDLGDGLTGTGENQGNIDVTTSDGVTLTGGGADAYAQVGNGGDHVNANASSSASGSNTGNVTVDAGSGAVTITAGVDVSSYVQIGNGGFDVNAGDNPANFSDSGTIVVSDLTLLGSNNGMDGYAQVGNGDASDNGVGDATGNITVSAGIIVLTDGTAKDSPALIGNQTGAGSISGTITGYTPPSTDNNPPPPVVGAIETTIQSQTGEPVVITIIPPELLPPPSGDSGTPPQSTGPLEQLTGGEGQSSQSADTATDQLGQSLGNRKHVQIVPLIPGMLTEVVYTQTPHGIPPANQDFSSWGNEALWRW